MFSVRSFVLRVFRLCGGEFLFKRLKRNQKIAGGYNAASDALSVYLLAPYRRRGLRILSPDTPYSVRAYSLRRSSSPKHNHYVGLCLGTQVGGIAAFGRCKNC